MAQIDCQSVLRRHRRYHSPDAGKRRIPGPRCRNGPERSRHAARTKVPKRVPKSAAEIAEMPVLQRVLTTPTVPTELRRGW
jgi:hypothetical protein